ncbi:HAD-IA family hydrolase [Microbulbifer thermotolerans]|uniref:HAD family hydrolase n=1 Tax=Microbulbifer thermotolerans TaxID=252514 RepID=UPI0026716D06|nr:HAD-IA family hydrolase [Microbulbifer thermotolerans]WKT61955.1 HAD-IA family hydrolase [Microbulbifer thermotolerans]
MKAVLFDLDGTLFDTAPDFIRVLNQLRREEQLPPLPDSEIRAVVSNGARALVTLGFGTDENHPTFEGLRQRLLDLYLAHLAEKTQPFPGIEPLLHRLSERGIAWGIVTNKPEAYTTRLMRAFSHLPTPGAVICPDHVANRKPDPEPILLACQQIGCRPEEAIYAGDHERDIAAGRAAGLPTIACSYGYIDNGDDPARWGADHLVHSAEEIWPLLQRHYIENSELGPFNTSGLKTSL